MVGPPVTAELMPMALKILKIIGEKRKNIVIIIMRNNNDKSDKWYDFFQPQSRWSLALNIHLIMSGNFHKPANDFELFTRY